jgi:hypothetical protein
VRENKYKGLALWRDKLLLLLSRLPFQPFSYTGPAGSIGVHESSTAMTSIVVPLGTVDGSTASFLNS